MAGSTPTVNLTTGIQGARPHSADKFDTRCITKDQDTSHSFSLRSWIPRQGSGVRVVGKLHLSLITIAGFCLTIGFFAWTRLIVQSATMLWLFAALLVLIAPFAVIHPVVLAARSRGVSAKRYNRWWFRLIWSLGNVLIGAAPS